MNLKRWPLVLGALCLSPMAANAESLSWAGFISQGYVHSDANNFYGESPDGSWDFRELGVNARYVMNEDLAFAGQLMSRRAGAVDSGSLQLDYLFADLHLGACQSCQQGVRIGRMKNPYGLYNQTRDVPFTRPSVILPQSIYFDFARDFELSADGVMLYKVFALQEHVVDLSITLGVPPHDENVEYAFLGNDWPGRFEASRGVIGRMHVQPLDGNFAWGVSLGRCELDYANSGQGSLLEPTSGELPVYIGVLSAQYNLRDWTLSAEYFRQTGDWAELDRMNLTPQDSPELESYYLQAQYRFAQNWDMVMRFDQLYMDRGDRNGQNFRREYQALGIDRPAHTRYARDWMLGLGWQPAPQWLLRAEWHEIRGTAWLSAQDNPDASSLKRKWNLFALQATYRF